MNAYDITMGEFEAAAPRPRGQGWCFGLPPGIPPAHWPLDPNTGFPLMHGFTLLLPDDYRVHGPAIAALSFFATAPDHNDGGRAPRRPDLRALIEAPGAAPPADRTLLPWWHRARGAHPRLHRMRDILGYGYAIVLLTQTEFDGPPCHPPEPVDDPLLAQENSPDWLKSGSAVAYEQFIGRPGTAPAGDGFMLHRPLTWAPRPVDPNAGLAPRETWDEPAETGYHSFFFWEGGVVEQQNYREHDWVQGHAPNHIGGTMRPIQAVPSLSPFYVGFEEAMGGYNFGSGNAQLDFRDMELDWAC